MLFTKHAQTGSYLFGDLSVATYVEVVHVIKLGVPLSAVERISPRVPTVSTPAAVIIAMRLQTFLPQNLNYFLPNTKLKGIIS